MLKMLSHQGRYLFNFFILLTFVKYVKYIIIYLILIDYVDIF